MFRLIARMVVKRTLRAHLNRDVEAILKTYSKDVCFRFPGNNSWAGEFRGIDQVRPWLQRTDNLKAPDGTLVYENSGFIYAKGAWGKVREYEVVEDTEKVAALDEWLKAHERAPS